MSTCLYRKTSRTLRPSNTSWLNHFFQYGYIRPLIGEERRPGSLRVRVSLILAATVNVVHFAMFIEEKEKHITKDTTTMNADLTSHNSCKRL